MCIPDSRYGLTLAWVTSKNSTMLLESDILRLFFTGPYLVSSPLCSVSGVDCPSVLPRQLLLFASLLSSRNSSLGSSHHSSAGLQPPNPLLVSSHQLPTASLWSSHQLLLSCPTTNSSLGSSHQLSCPTTNCLSWAPATNCLSLGRVVNSHSRVQPPTLLSPVQLPTPLQPPTVFCCLPLCSPATNSSLLSCHQLSSLLASLCSGVSC